MRKLLAVFLAAVLLLALVPTAAFAKIGNEDAIMDELLSNSFEHVQYVNDKNGFRNELRLYGISHLDTWSNYFTGAADADATKTILLGLIDRMEAEYNNETFETILNALKGVSTVAEMVNKVDEITGILDIAQNSTWLTSLSILNNAIKIANFGNEEYEKFVEGYAVILSVQAASIYYGEFLQYLIDHSENKGIRDAAAELKEDITISLEEARDQLISQLTADAGKGVATLGINIAMSSFGVTATIQTVYNAATGIGDLLFNSTEIYQYMNSLALITEIETLLPGYFAEVVATADGDEEAVTFAKIAILTLRETGETMLANLGKVKGDSIVSRIFNNTSEASQLAEISARSKAKLQVFHDIILDADDHTSYLIQVDTTAGKNLTVRHPDGSKLETLQNGKPSKLINDYGAFYCIHDEELAKYYRVVVTFVDGCNVELTTTSNNSNTKPGNGSSGGGFFASLIKAIQDFFKALFGAFKF